MNYEELYSEYLTKEKELRDQINIQLKFFKRVVKEMNDGDIKAAGKDITSLHEASQKSEQISTDIQKLAEGFDLNTYIKSGEFAEQMLDYCEKSGVDAKGENNIYEMFPYKVKLDGENADIWLDRKKASFFRPQSLVAFIKAQRDKLMSAFFNPTVFANELAKAYDLFLLVQANDKKHDIAYESDVYLNGLYKYLTPMKRFRRDYDMQSFTFDISRLYSAEVVNTDDGRCIQFGPSRKNDKALRVLDKNSNEEFLATVRFYKVME